MTGTERDPCHSSSWRSDSVAHWTVLGFCNGRARSTYIQTAGKPGFGQMGLKVGAEKYFACTGNATGCNSSKVVVKIW